MRTELQNILERVRLLLWIFFTGSFIVGSSFILLDTSRQDLCHIPNDLPMWKQFHFPRQNVSSQLLNLILPPDEMMLSLIEK